MGNSIQLKWVKKSHWEGEHGDLHWHGINCTILTGACDQISFKPACSATESAFNKIFLDCKKDKDTDQTEQMYRFLFHIHVYQYVYVVIFVVVVIVTSIVIYSTVKPAT